MIEIMFLLLKILLLFHTSYGFWRLLILSAYSSPGSSARSGLSSSWSCMKEAIMGGSALVAIARCVSTSSFRCASPWRRWRAG